jgi:DNA-binding transcriptional LysR family regulator
MPILLEPLIASFCQANPEVEVEIAASEELVDIAAKGFDAGIRLGQFIAADMIAVRLTPPFPLVVVGSAEYLRRRGRPERIDDLRQHACLRIRRSNGAIAPWSFVSGNKLIEAIVSGPLIAHDFPTMLGAAVEDMGLAQVPEPIAAGPVKAGKLVQVLEPFAPMAPGVFLYYPSRRQMMPKLRAFIDHVKRPPGATNRTRSQIDDKRSLGVKMRRRGKRGPQEV